MTNDNIVLSDEYKAPNGIEKIEQNEKKNFTWCSNFFFRIYKDTLDILK